jgi:tetratricopeptide (TPR) repeat protein
MATSLKAELDTWAAALKAYDEQDFPKALDLFSGIADSSKILTNMGLIYATIGEHEAAVQQFMAAIALDPFLAIAYFQCGVSNFLLSRYDVALQNFDDALLYLRGNQTINYEQIGLKFKLFSPEVLFNKGLSHIYLGYPAEGLAEMEDARNLKVTDEHDVIDDAIKDRGEGYTVFSIPVGVLYRPSENKLKNSKSKDYLGKAKLVAASDATDAFTEFTGVKKLKEEREKAKERDQERNEEGLRRSATVPPPRTEPIGRPTVERSKTTNAGLKPTIPAFPSIADMAFPLPPASGLSRSNTVAPPRVNISTFASSRPPTDDAPALSPTSPLTRNNSVPPSRSNTIMRPTTPSGVAVSRGLTIRKKEPLPSQVVNQPGALFQPAFAPQSYPDILQVPQQYQQQLYQNQPLLARNQYQQPQPYQTQTPPDNGYQVPPSSLQPGHPVPKTPFVLRAAPPSQETSTRQPDLLDDYIGSYTEDYSRSVVQGSLLNMGVDRVALWPQGSAQSGPVAMSSSTGVTIQQMPSRNGLGNQGSLNSEAAIGVNISRAGGGSMRRKPTRRATQRRPKPTYEEEEEGYVTGENDESYESSIRVKLHYQGELRGMTLMLNVTFEEFVERVTSKFGTPMDGLSFKFKDEDDGQVTLRDESDFELALETARANAKGRDEGKLEVWCTDM